MICKRCGYVWTSRIEYPKACPNCKSFLWDTNSTKKSKKYKLGSCILCGRQEVRLCKHHPDGMHGAITHEKLYICFKCHGIIGRYHHHYYKNRCIDEDIQLLTEKMNILLKIKQMGLVKSDKNQTASSQPIPIHSNIKQ